MTSGMDMNWLQQQFPRVRNLTRLTHGGQKIVLMGDHEHDGPVVIKLVQGHADDTRVEREILAESLVERVSVPRVYDHGRLAGPLGHVLWLREQRVSGQTVRQCLSSGPFEVAEATRLGAEVLLVLVAAERRRIVHRDIKPENLMRDDEKKYWVLDFGVSRHLDLESITATRQRFGVGTLGYASPEQIRNRKHEIDARADLFSLGVVLYECVTGYNPYHHGAANELDVLRRVESMEFPRLELGAGPGLEDFCDFIYCLTQRYPTRRPASTSEALAWLNEIIDSMEKLQ